MEHQTLLQRRRLAGAWIVGPVFCLLLLSAPYGVQAEGGSQKEQPKSPVLERYRKAWEAHKGELDLALIAQLAADLGSKDTSARRVAFARLKAETGLDRVNWHYVFDPDGDPAEQKRIRQDWEDYARWLNVAVKKVVPLLMENRGETTRRSGHLGRSAWASVRRTARSCRCCARSSPIRRKRNTCGTARFAASR